MPKGFKAYSVAMAMNAQITIGKINRNHAKYKIRIKIIIIHFIFLGRENPILTDLLGIKMFSMTKKCIIL